MKMYSVRLLIALSCLLFLSGCGKLFQHPAPPTACLSVFAKNNGTYYSIFNQYRSGNIYIGDTIKFVCCSTPHGSYVWQFGDGSTATTTDTVTYHIYTGFTPFVNSTVQVTVIGNTGRDSTILQVDIQYPLTSFPGTICHAGASSNGYHFFTNADSTFVLSNMTVITYDSIRARCIMLNPRTFIIPIQSRTSTAGFPYTVHGHGNVYTDPNNSVASFLAITDTLDYASGYGYACYDTIPLSY